MFSRSELNDLYNCVTIVIANRERDNEISSLFDEEFVDPIIDQLKTLEKKIVKLIDN
jgi:hypothetical protein